MVADRRSLEKVCGMPQLDHKKKPVCTFLPASYVGERTGSGLAVPVAAASQIAFSRGGDRIQLKSGVGIPEMNQKVEPRTGYQINRRSRASGKKIFTSME
jgi:hypothetical protein